MQNIKYHTINMFAVLLFSLVLSATINKFVKLIYMTPQSHYPKSQKPHSLTYSIGSWEDYKNLIDSGFFLIGESFTGDNYGSSPLSASSLHLLGTITGPSSIARALIKTTGEKEAKIYRLWTNVNGYRLVRILNTKVYLKSPGGETMTLDMFAGPRDASSRSGNGVLSPGAVRIKKNVSKSELQQKVFNNLDNALRGLRAGPYRVDGKIQGYKLFRIHPSSILYRYGARSGDIIRRVNGHTIDSTEKLYKMWENLKAESNINVDLERGGKLYNYNFSIKE